MPFQLCINGKGNVKNKENFISGARVIFPKLDVHFEKKYTFQIAIIVFPAPNPL